jgi:iron complex transport system ATP-binding protein
VLAAIHDLNMAALYCDRIYVIKDGKVVLEGTPEEVLTEETIRAIYNINCTVEKRSDTGKVSITYIPEHAKSTVNP